MGGGVTSEHGGSPFLGHEGGEVVRRVLEGERHGDLGSAARRVLVGVAGRGREEGWGSLREGWVSGCVIGWVRGFVRGIVKGSVIKLR